MPSDELGYSTSFYYEPGKSKLQEYPQLLLRPNNPLLPKT